MAPTCFRPKYTAHITDIMVCIPPKETPYTTAKAMPVPKEVVLMSSATPTAVRRKSIARQTRKGNRSKSAPQTKEATAPMPKKMLATVTARATESPTSVR